MINDEEALLKSIHSYVKSNLNTKISEINTEKDDDYDISSITADDDHYVFAGELQDLPNHAFVAFAIDGEIDVQGGHGQKISLPSISIEVVVDNEKKEGMYYKSFRYMRALYETILEYSAIEADDIQLTKFIPMIVSNRGRELVVSGVSLSVAIS
jgi:hypothetical protein